MSNLIELAWSVGSNGNLFADHKPKDARYCIDTRGEPMPFGMKLHSLMINGKMIGGAGSIEQCKQMAGRHAANGKL